MSDPLAPASSVSASVAKARELTGELRRLQERMETLDANLLQETVQKLQESVTRVTTRIQSALSSAEMNGISPMQRGAGSIANPRSKVEKMSSEVVDSNPYSRLMALQRMGIVKDYEKIRTKTVAIVGVGGVGSVAAEMLTRCGVGKLLLYDYDRVELANMNRLFFRPEQCGMTKTDAAAQTLTHINPDVDIESYTMNITTVEGFDKFKNSLSDTDGKSRVDLVLSCVDNYEARITINQVCLELKQTWMESGVSEDAVSGHIQQIIPGQTACFQCVPPLVVASGVDEKTLKREGVCAASLPTTMGIVAGMLVQNALKHMLQFGTVSKYLGYSSLKDFFPTMDIKPSVGCVNNLCRKLQDEWKAYQSSPEYIAARQAEEAALAAEVSGPTHAENEWGIEVVGSDEPEKSQTASSAAQDLPDGLEFSMPAAHVDASTLAAEAIKDVDGDVNDLMAQLNQLSASK